MTMELEIQSQDFTLTKELETYIRKQTKKLLGPYSGKVSKLVVRIRSIRQPNGSSDPQCCLEMHMPESRRFVVIKRCASARATIRKTIFSARRAARQRFGKGTGPRYFEPFGQLQAA